MAKEEIQLYKKSINESAFSSEQIAMIWDFYVTKSIAASASQNGQLKIMVSNHFLGRICVL